LHVGRRADGLGPDGHEQVVQSIEFQMPHGLDVFRQLRLQVGQLGQDVLVHLAPVIAFRELGTEALPAA
jgi:hypothetical protein